ncbi:MAG: ATP synthase F0 subunit C [Gemmatales bacterium]
MKVLNLCWIALAALALTALPAVAADGPTGPAVAANSTSGAMFGEMPKAVGVGLGCGLVVLGLGLGLGRIGGSALESMARQPEVSDKVATNMITIAALLEGAGIIALIFCLLGLFI